MRAPPLLAGAHSVALSAPLRCSLDSIALLSVAPLVATGCCLCGQAAPLEVSTVAPKRALLESELRQTQAGRVNIELKIKFINTVAICLTEGRGRRTHCGNYVACFAAIERLEFEFKAVIAGH